MDSTIQKLKMAEAKNDLIGAIHNSEIYELLGFHKVTSDGESVTWDSLTESIGKVAAGNANGILELAMNYGNEREETGFRIGFHMAMRLCMEGMKGGSLR